MKEYEIRPKELLDKLLELGAKDADELLQSAHEFEDRNCPGCGGHRADPAFAKFGFDYVSCGDCRTLFVNPSPMGSALDGFYRDSASAAYWARVFYPSVAQARQQKILAPRAGEIARRMEELGHGVNFLTDVGAGAGAFLEEIAKFYPDGELAAVEPNGEMAETCRENGFRTHEGNADDAAAHEDWNGRADLVTSFEVIEHVADTVAFMKGLAALTRPGGLILITGLHGGGYDIMTLGGAAKAVSPPHHLNFLSRAGVRRLLERSGLEEISFETPGKLDVDIVTNAYAGQPGLAKDPFLRFLMTEADEKTKEDFQAFLADAGLSSHMRIIARKN
ncbi:MAG: class I SAM-dependent methyltransferase [Rhodospirillales bacterium]|nr:class I SAM-dependent methyltransferase [Rhodospirillales bacterium]